jgi:hypothetical protein
MRKIILFVLLTSSILSSYAQTSIGLIGGYNHSTLRSNDDNLAERGIDNSYYSGWRAGIITDHHLFGKFYLQPQLLINTKGYNISFKNTNGNAYQMNHLSRRLTYLELQTNLLFKQQAGTGKFFVGAGPYIGRGISGLERFDGDYQDGRTFTSYYTIKYSSKEPGNPNNQLSGVTYMKPYDAGVNFLAGYELKNGLFFNAVYSLGLNHQFFGQVGNDGDKNTYFGLSIGYFFKKFS